MAQLVCASAKLTGVEPRKRVLRGSVAELLTDWLQGQQGYSNPESAKRAAEDSVAEFPALMTVNQVAGVLGISRASVYRLLDAPPEDAERLNV